MPEERVKEAAKKDLEEGRAPSTAAGEFVREEMHHVREGKHGARSTKQAIAIGLSKARRSGVPLAPPKAGRQSEETVEAAQQDYAIGQGRRKPRAPSRRRSRATKAVLRREGRGAARKSALAKQARSAARRRSSAERSRAAQKAVKTKGRLGRSRAARKAAATRRRRR